MNTTKFSAAKQMRWKPSRLQRKHIRNWCMFCYGGLHGGATIRFRGDTVEVSANCQSVANTVAAHVANMAGMGLV